MYTYECAELSYEIFENQAYLPATTDLHSSSKYRACKSMHKDSIELTCKPTHTLYMRILHCSLKTDPCVPYDGA